MKTSLFLVIFFSISLFAQSDFDKGVEYGKYLCNQQYWSCQLTYTAIYPNGETEKNAVFSEARTLVEGKEQIRNYCLNSRKIYHKKACLDKLREGSTTCKPI
jgi:hypothetical protein